MGLACRDHEVFSFVGEVIEGYDGHIYLFDVVDHSLYELCGRKIIHIYQLFDDKMGFIKSGRRITVYVPYIMQKMWCFCLME